MRGHSVPLSETIISGLPRPLMIRSSFAARPSVQTAKCRPPGPDTSLPRAVIDHDEDAEAPPVSSVSETKSRLPALVRLLRSTVAGARVPSARLRPPALAHRQPFLSVEPKSFWWLSVRPLRRTG